MIQFIASASKGPVGSFASSPLGPLPGEIAPDLHVDPRPQSGLTLSVRIPAGPLSLKGFRAPFAGMVLQQVDPPDSCPVPFMPGLAARPFPLVHSRVICSTGSNNRMTRPNANVTRDEAGTWEARGKPHTPLLGEQHLACQHVKRQPRGLVRRPPPSRLRFHRRRPHHWRCD